MQLLIHSRTSTVAASKFGSEKINSRVTKFTDAYVPWLITSFQWSHNERVGVSNHQPYDCSLNRLFRHRSKKTSKLRVTSLCVRNSPGTGEFPAQMASNAENVSIWWRHHVISDCKGSTQQLLHLGTLSIDYHRGHMDHDNVLNHYSDVTMAAIASQITSLTIVYSTVDSDADQREHQSSASLAFLWGIHRGPVNFPHKWPVTRKMSPFDDVIMLYLTAKVTQSNCFI